MTAEPSASLRKSRSVGTKLLLFLVLPAGVLIFVALLAHALWRGKERAQADAWVAKIVAAGGPVTIAALDDAPVADSRNIVVLYRQAIAAFVEDEELETRQRELDQDDDYAFEPPLTAVEADLLRSRLTTQGAALKLLGGMSERDAVAWEPAPKTLTVMWLMPELNGMRRTANLLADRARLSAHEGRSVEALDALIDVPPIAIAASHRPNLVGMLVSVGIRALAADRLIELAPSLDVEDAAVRERMKGIIAELIDDRLIVDAKRRGYTGERAAIHEMMRAVVSGQLALNAVTGAAGLPGNGAAIYVMSPMLYAADASMLQYFTAALAIIDAPSLADFKARSGPMTAVEKAVSASNLNVFAKIIVPSLGRAFNTGYRVATDRHLAATVLAIRLYQRDHAGARPATLDELVPQYLPAVPSDPIDGKPLRYDVTRAIIWSVGDTEADDGGDTTTSYPQYHGRWTMRDAVVHLDRQPRPATRPAGG